MKKTTAFAITFFLISLIFLLSYHVGDPAPGENKYHLADPRDVEINGINFTVSWGFAEDENSSGLKHSEIILGHNATKEERTFHQNDILLLDIQVYDFGENHITLSDLNGLYYVDYQNKSINGVLGMFKMNLSKLPQAL